METERTGGVASVGSQDRHHETALKAKAVLRQNLIPLSGRRPMLSRQVKERLGDGRQRGGQQCGCIGSPPFGVGRRAAYGRTGPIVANRLSGSGRPSAVAMVEATDFANRPDLA